MSATPSWKPSVLSTFGSNVPASVKVARTSPASAPRLSRSRAEERSPDLMKSSARWSMEANSSRSSCRVTKSGIVLFRADGGARVGATGTDGAGATAVNSLRSKSAHRFLQISRFLRRFRRDAALPVRQWRFWKLLRRIGRDRSPQKTRPHKIAFKQQAGARDRHHDPDDDCRQTQNANSRERDCPVRSAVRLGLWWFRNPFRIKCQSTLYLCDRPITPGLARSAAAIRVHCRGGWLGRHKVSLPDPWRCVHKGGVNMLGVADRGTHRRLPYFHLPRPQTHSDFSVDGFNVVTSALGLAAK